MDSGFRFFLRLITSSSLAAMPTCLPLPELIHKICERLCARFAYPARGGNNASKLMCRLTHLRNHRSKSRLCVISLNN